MLKRFAARLALALGLVLGVAITYVPRAFATRNSSGTYSLPAGNPVVSGTTISSATHNSTMSDIATALTDSLDRNGKGAMLAPLQCANGTVAAPALTFGTDTDTGLYRIGANNPGFAAGGTKVWECTATGCTFPLLLAVTGAQTNAAGVTITQSTTNGAGLTVTGNGTGAGAVITGGASQTNAQSAATITADASGNGRGITVVAAGTGTGATITGGASSGTGLIVTGGASDGAAIYAIGGATNGRAGLFQGTGTGAAIEINQGRLHMSGTNPLPTVGFTKSLTSMNLIAAWAIIESSSSALTILDGFNVTTPAASGTDCITIDLVNDLLGPTAGVFATMSDVTAPIQGVYFGAGMTSAGQAQVCAFTGGGAFDLTSASGARTSILVLGAQ
jgi:hypothetical protein